MNKLTFEDIREKGLLLYEHLRGSHAYGTQLPTSDIDMGAVFIEPKEWLMGLGVEYQDQVSDATNDTTWYALKKYMNLLMTANPNMIETLFIDDKFVIYEHPLFSEIKKNREKFITKDCFKPFIGYATTQIKKCRSLHKMFLNEDIEKKEPLDFCYTFFGQGSTKIKNWLEHRGLYQRYCGLVNTPNMHDVYTTFYDFGNHMSEKGIMVEDIKIAYKEQNGDVLSKFANFVVEHFNLKAKTQYDACEDVMGTLVNIEEWYASTKPIGYRGIVGDDGQSHEVRLSSVKKDEEPICHISYNETGYTKHCIDYKNYQDWKEHRNPNRYLENKGKTFDRKNVAHAIRLMHMGKEIARDGKVNVDRTNIDRDFILSVRLGERTYEEVIDYVERQKAEMEELMAKSTLPEHPDYDFFNNLLIGLREDFYKNYAI